MKTIQEQMTETIQALRSAGLHEPCIALVLRAFGHDPALKAESLEVLGQEALVKRLKDHDSIGDLHDEIQRIVENPWVILAVIERGRDHQHDSHAKAVRVLNG